MRKGELLREVRAPGTLVPEHIRIIAAATAGRVEILPVRPGVTVTPSTLLVELSNTDVQLQALSADQAVTAARGQLASLRRQLQQSRLAQEGTIAQLKHAARRRQPTDQGRRGAGQERAGFGQRDRRRARPLQGIQTRTTIEQQQLDEMNSSAKEQLQLTEDQVQSLTAIAAEQRNRVRSMHVVAWRTAFCFRCPWSSASG